MSKSLLYCDHTIKQALDEWYDCPLELGEVLQTFISKPVIEAPTETLVNFHYAHDDGFVYSDTGGLHFVDHDGNHHLLGECGRYDRKHMVIKRFTSHSFNVAEAADGCYEVDVCGTSRVSELIIGRSVIPVRGTCVVCFIYNGSVAIVMENDNMRTIIRATKSQITYYRDEYVDWATYLMVQHPGVVHSNGQMIIFPDIALEYDYNQVPCV